MKYLLITAALMMAPAAALAQDPPADPGMAAGASLPMCSAKVHDSCMQTKAQQASALDHYPADSRDAGNNKIGAPMAPHHPTRAMHRAYKTHSVGKSIVTTPSAPQ